MFVPSTQEEKRIDKLHPVEAKRSCDSLDRSLQNLEEAVRSLFRDIQTLQDGSYPQTDTLYKR